MQDVAGVKTTTPAAAAANGVGVEAYLAIQRFLFVEAALLDRRDYRGWLALLTDDVTYRVLAYVNRDAVIDEPAFRLKARVEQILNSKLTHAENPPTLTRRFVSNVIAAAGERAGEYIVTSNLLVYRTRPSISEGALYAGERNDVLRELHGSLRIARREVRLDQSVLHGSISTLL